MDMQRTELLGRYQEATTDRRTSKETLRIRLYAALLTLDLGAILLGFVLGGATRFGQPLAEEVWRSFILVAPVYAGVAIVGQAYGIETLKNAPVGVWRAVRSLLIAASTVLFIAFFLRSSEELSRATIAVGLLSSAGLLVAARLSFDTLLERHTDRRFVDELVIVDDRSIELPLGASVVAADSSGLEPDSDNPMMLDRLSRVLQYVDRVVVVCHGDKAHAWAHVLKGIDVHAEICTDRFDLIEDCQFGRFAGYPTIVVSGGPLSLPNRALKRLLDLAIAVPAVIFLAPALIAVALAIKFDSPGPVLFRQQRMGQGNRLFMMYKFRSMRTELCDSNGTRSAARDDDRVTRIGRFIRRTSIDEVPQLFNVIRGDMSLVGPRPHALGSTVDDRLFWHVDAQYWHRHTLKPGITGLAQIRGLRGATLRRADLSRRVQADLEYISNWSLAKDLYILFATFRVIVHRNAF